MFIGRQRPANQTITYSLTISLRIVKDTKYTRKDDHSTIDSVHVHSNNVNWKNTVNKVGRRN